MSRQVYRLEPALPAHAMKTYHIARPVPTHFKMVGCKEAGCRAYQRGWQTTVDTSTTIGQKRANYIRLRSGRSFSFTQTGTLVVFTFSPGQKCFAEHQVPVGREPIFAVKEGDWRGNPRGSTPTIFKGSRQFIDDFGEHQTKLADRLKRG